MKKRGKTISIKIFIGLFSLSLLILGVISSELGNTYGSMIKEQEIQYHLELTNSTKEQLNMLIKMIDETMYRVWKNESVQSVVHKESPDLALEEEKNNIKMYINAIPEMNYSVNAVHILGTNGYVETTNYQFGAKQVQSYYQKYLDGFRNSNERNGIWTEFHTVEDDNYLSNTSYIKPVFDSDTKEVYGIVIIDVSYESIHKVFTASSIRTKDKAAIVNSKGNILMQYPINADYSSILSQNKDVLKGDVQKEGKLFKQDAIIVSQSLNIADWVLVRFVKEDAATIVFTNMLKKFQSMIVIVLLIALFWTVFLTRMITKPLKKLVGVCEQVSMGDFSACVEVKSEDEFGRLGAAFNTMITQINDSFQKERANQERKAEMEFQILQAQINPHFLYNTLDSIKWLSVMQGIDNIAEMTTALINLLKYNLGKVKGEITLREEVESVKNYITIQKYRYSDIFEFTTMIEEEALECQVLRFTLQPLVENCIIHGFGEDGRNYRIHIAAIIIENMLHIRVIDNGKGMDEKSKNKLNKGQSMDTRFSNIGVQSVRERIKLYFGEESDLKFDCKPNFATIAEIIIPVII